MSDIRYFLQSQLLEPLKQYPTVIQDTMLELIAQRLQTLYEYTIQFPEIVSPNMNRLDILKAIADQFLFTVRDEADIREQIDILDNILYIYNKRGSIDTIENMWKYYGGDLPKDVKVILPSYNLFRYSVSKLSGTHRFPNGGYIGITLDTPAPHSIALGSTLRKVGTNLQKVTTGVSAGSYSVFLTNTDGLVEGDRVNIAGIYEGTIVQIPKVKIEEFVSPNVYEVRLTNNTYPVADLKEFLIKELVAAGSYIYFTNTLHMDVSNSNYDTNPYKYLVYEKTVLDIQLEVLKAHQGFTWSGYNTLSPNPIPEIYDRNLFSETDISRMTKYRNPNESLYSGRASIFLELTKMIDLPMINKYEYIPDLLGFSLTLEPLITDIKYRTPIYRKTEYTINSFLYCTPIDLKVFIARDLYDRDDNLITSKYPGYFILGETLLGEGVV